MIKKVFPSACPSCGQVLSARRFECPDCGTAVEGEFPLPVLLRLSPEEQAFVVHFIKCGGALKDLAQVYRVSYPTVRNRLDALIGKIAAMSEEGTQQSGEEDQES